MAAQLGTHCPYCAFQCGMTIALEGGEARIGARDFPTNKGGLCRKGWTAAALLAAPGRLTEPLMRSHKGAPLRPVSWDDALDRVAAGFKATQAAHGRDAVGVFGGGGLTNEKAYMLGKFARVALRSRYIDYNGRFCMASAAAAGNKALGIDRGLPFPLEDLPQAEVILIAGGNPAESMPVMMQYFEAQKARGGQLLVADPRRTATARAAGLHLQITPGTDGALANGLLHIAVRDHLIDPEFIAARTTGFDAVRHTVAAYWPDRVERITGVPAATLVKTAHLLGEASTAIILTGRGLEQQVNGVSNVLACINLALALGKVGRTGCGWGTLTGQGNGQGGREHGQKADQLPGYRSILDPAHRAFVANVWDVPEASLPGAGVSATELLGLLGSEIRALLLMASNPVVSAPNSGPVLERLKSLDLLVVNDFFLSETAELADVVLPVTQWAEEEGTMTNLEGRVLRRHRLSPPPPGVRSDAQVLKALADRLGAGAHFSAEPEVIFDELCRASAGGVADYAGITYARIDAEDGVFWPCPSIDHPGTPRLFVDRFPTPDGRARFHRVEHRPPAEEPDEQFPLFLTTGRLLLHYQSGAQTRRVPELAAAEPAPFVEIHPQMARNYGIADGDLVRLRTRRGSAVLGARFSDMARLDTVFVPFHWGGAACANLLTNDALDPTSKIPEFKVCAVQIERVGGAMPGPPVTMQ
ncbi:MAG: molybdopterin oxidoreductase family protein [Geminicoccaceae bacterium]